MVQWLLPAFAAASWGGVLAWSAVAPSLPPWAPIAVGMAMVVTAAALAPRVAPRPGALEAARAVREAAAVTAVASERLERGRGRSVVALPLALLGVGLLAAGWAGVHEARLDDSLLRRIAPRGVEAAGFVREAPEAGAYGWSAIIGLEWVRLDGPPVPSGERVFVEGPGRPPSVETGDRVRLVGLVAAPRDPGFAASLRRRAVAAIIFADEFRRVGPASGALARGGQRVRAALESAIGRSFPEREGGLLLSLALGQAATLDPSLERDFRAAGLAHLLVVSGANVAMLLAPVLGFAVMLRLSPGVRFGLGAMTIAFIVLIAGPEPSVLRAGVMAALSLLGIVSGRPRSSASLLGAAVTVLILADPFLAHSIGFQLSVAATAGIVVLATPIARRLRPLSQPVAVAAGTTLAAQLGVAPLLLLHFGEVAGVSVAANLLAFPAVAPSLLLGLAAAALGAVWHPLGRIAAGLALVPLRYLEEVADRAATAPVPWITSSGAWLVLVVATVLSLVRRRPRRHGGAGRRPAGRTLAVALFLAVVVWATALSSGPPSGLRVTFFDVGQGDAALMRSPSGATVLVDAGPDPDEVAARLSELGVRRLDVVVASHPHADHVVGLPAVLARLPVGLVLEPGCRDTSPVARAVGDALADERVKVAHPRMGDAYAVGDLRIDVVSPERCFAGTESDANNDAIVIRLAYREDTVLFATEPEEPAQQAMLDARVPLTADVFKVPHHGAATSLPAFFDAVDARVAIVSVGENPYGHPAPETLDALRRTGALVLRTDRAGDITVEFERGGLRIESVA